MAHNLTSRDGMFTVREAAWHGLGNVLEDYPSIAEAKSIAHPWEPEYEPIYRAVPIVGADGPTVEYVEVETHRAVRRSDDHGLLGVQSDTYELVGNQEMYDIAEALESGAGDVRLETGGSLKGGRKVWLLLRLNEPLTLPGDDSPVIPYYALQNAHDGSGAFRGQATMTRIVCDNTAQMADLDANQRGTEFVFKHSKGIKSRIEEAKDALAGWRESVQAYNRLAEHLIGMKVTPEQREIFVQEFIPMPVGKVISPRVTGNVENARADLRKIMSSETTLQVQDSAWGLVQGGIEFWQHARRANSNENRFNRSYLKRSRLTTDAVELARAVALA